MRKKIFVLFFLFCLIFSSCVYADNSVQEKVESIISDLYLSEENYILEKAINGNVFAAAKDFEMLDTASISGNLFVGANKVTLKSTVTYSEETSKDNNTAITSINSKSTIKGNVYIVCKELVIEPGCEISGDLYVVANSVDIQKSATINGNLFVTSVDCILNGRVQKSIYAACKSFFMNYYGSVANDLHLSSQEAVLNSLISRNAFIDSETIKTSQDFMLNGNLEANAQVFDFSGEIDGNAKINAKELNFISSKEDTTIKCSIKGNLDYSTSEELEEVTNSVVKGDVTFSPYKEQEISKPSFSIKDFIIELISFVLYVFVIVWLFTIFAKAYVNTKHEITVKNIFASLGIGLLSIICVSILTILLIIISVGSKLALILLVAYALILLLSTPLFVLDIAQLLKEKLNFYLLVPLLALALFIISQIPFIGEFIMFLFVITGTGRIIKNIITKANKNN